MYAFSIRAMPGGWKTIDITKTPIPEITKWAVEEYFKSNVPTQYFPLYAQEQVVAGINYKIWIKIITSSRYQVWEFVVYDHMGEKSITSAKILSH